jgi:hypothetical protein
MLHWHPRDVDTLQEIYRDRAEESSLAQQRAAIMAQGLGRT